MYVWALNEWLQRFVPMKKQTVEPFNVFGYSHLKIIFQTRYEYIKNLISSGTFITVFNLITP